MTANPFLFKDDEEHADAWIDGASSGNPGPAGVGVVIKKGDKTVGSWQEFLGETTNNVAEYRSLILALSKALELGLRSLVVHTDSELLYRQLTGHYKVRNPGIFKLFREVQELRRRFRLLRIEHVPREENGEADRLARAARG